ncbi:MAG: hypothetical protein AB1635_19930 [Acidobacteriota bacterium]
MLRTLAKHDPCPLRVSTLGEFVMEINKLVFGGLAFGCIAAAGAGAYLAVRQNAVEPAAPVAAAEPAAAAATLPSAATAVAETEARIEPAAARAPAPPAQPSGSMPAPIAEPASRPASRAPGSVPATRSTTPRPRSAPAAAEPAPVAAPLPVPAAGSMWEARPAVEAEPAPRFDPEPVEPPVPDIIELVVPADSVLGLQIERTISSEMARVEDRVEARVTRDVRVGDRVAIPAGAIVHGAVTEVERGGKVKETARLAVRFHTVVLANGTRLAIRTDAVVREGQSPGQESAAKIGGAAVGGAILGAILGGGRGAAIGGAVGAAGGTAAQMAGGRNPAVLPAGSTVSVRIQSPVTVTVEP